MRLLLPLVAALGLTAAPVAAQDAGNAARQWIEEVSARPGNWQDIGRLEFPSGQIFVGDPTWGDDYHIRDPRPLDRPSLQAFVRTAPEGYNLLIWLEAKGTRPTATGERIEFGVDAATIGLGDLGSGQALVDLGEARMDQGQGDSFEWLSPYIQQRPDFARFLPIPPDDRPIMLVSTRSDGGYAAVWLLDATGALSGILIDIAGREPDLKFLDVLLPAAG